MIIEKDLHTNYLDYFTHKQAKKYFTVLFRDIDRLSKKLKASRSIRRVLKISMAKAFSTCQMLDHTEFEDMQKAYGLNNIQLLRVQEVIRLFESYCLKALQTKVDLEALILMIFITTFADIDVLRSRKVELSLKNKYGETKVPNDEYFVNDYEESLIDSLKNVGFRDGDNREGLIQIEYYALKSIQFNLPNLLTTYH